MGSFVLHMDRFFSTNRVTVNTQHAVQQQQSVNSVDTFIDFFFPCEIYVWISYLHTIEHLYKLTLDLSSIVSCNVVSSAFVESHSTKVENITRRKFGPFVFDASCDEGTNPREETIVSKNDGLGLMTQTYCVGGDGQIIHDGFFSARFFSTFTVKSVQNMLTVENFVMSKTGYKNANRICYSQWRDLIFSILRTITGLLILMLLLLLSLSCHVI